jgi:hypothetical protein
MLYDRKQEKYKHTLDRKRLYSELLPSKLTCVADLRRRTLI